MKTFLVTLSILTFISFSSCSKSEVIAEYDINWKKCLNGTIQLFDDLTYHLKCDNKEEEGTWYFQSEIDSVLCINRHDKLTTTTNVTRNYFIQNNLLYPLEHFEITEDFEWTLGKSGPSWIPSEAFNHAGPHFEDTTQIISAIDSSEWNYVYKAENGNFHLTLTGYYFMENQPGQSAGGTDYEAKAFLALEKNEKIIYSSVTNE